MSVCTFLLYKNHPGKQFRAQHACFIVLRRVKIWSNLCRAPRTNSRDTRVNYVYVVDGSRINFCGLFSGNWNSFYDTSRRSPDRNTPIRLCFMHVTWKLGISFARIRSRWPIDCSKQWPYCPASERWTLALIRTRNWHRISNLLCVSWRAEEVAGSWWSKDLLP